MLVARPPVGEREGVCVCVCVMNAREWKGERKVCDCTVGDKNAGSGQARRVIYMYAMREAVL